MSTEQSIIGYLLTCASFRKHKSDLYAVLQTIRSEERFTEDKPRQAFVSIRTLALSGKSPTVQVVAGDSGLDAEMLKSWALQTAIKIRDEADMAASGLVSQSLQRTAIDALTRHIGDLKNSGASSESLARISQSLLEICDEHEGGTRSGGSLTELLDGYVERLEYERDNPDEILNLRFGIESVDRMMGKRIRGGSVLLVGAHSGAGKSVLATQILQTNGLDGRGLNPALLSLEMPEYELLDRVVAAHGPMDYGRIVDRELDDADFRRMREIRADLIERGAGTWLEAMRSPKIEDLANRMRMLAAGHGKRLFIIDYVQLIRGYRAHGREREVNEISEDLKQLAIDLDAVVVLLAQLNDEMFSRSGEGIRPKIHEMRESKALVKNADVSFVIDRPGMDGRDKPVFWDGEPAYTQHPSTADLCEFVRFDFGKARRGRKGMQARHSKSWVTVRFEGVYQRFTDPPEWGDSQQSFSPVSFNDAEPF